MTESQSPGAACALIAFEGTTVEDRIAEQLADPRVAGVTLYGSINIENAEQTRRLTADLQRAAGRRLLIAVDQEGGQLTAAGPETTHFAGNMAIGAVGDDDLALRGRNGNRSRAGGARHQPQLCPGGRHRQPARQPVAGDQIVRRRPGGRQPSDGRHGDGPAIVRGGGHPQALSRARAKPQVDPHLELPVLDLDLERLESGRVRPFRAGIEAGAHFVMIGHYGLPAVTGNRHLPTSASSAVLRGLVRDQLGFDGVIVTDALDMGAFRGRCRCRGTALQAGADLLLLRTGSGRHAAGAIRPMLRHDCEQGAGAGWPAFSPTRIRPSSDAPSTPPSPLNWQPDRSLWFAMIRTGFR